MTNTIALILALALAAFIGIDYQLYDFEMSLFLARKIGALSEWMAFWR
jgi:hypothetical protein